MLKSFRKLGKDERGLNVSVELMFVMGIITVIVAAVGVALNSSLTAGAEAVGTQITDTITEGVIGEE